MSKGKYLEEDKDIISRLDKLSGSGFKSQAELSKFQIEAILRNRKSLEDSSKATRKFSILLFTVALLQLLLAFFQFGFSIIESKNIWFGIGFLCVFLGFMYWFVENSEKK